MGRTVIASDSFTGTDGTQIYVYLSNWSEQNGSTGLTRINLNRFRGGLGVWADNSWQGAGTFTANQYAEIALVGTIDNASTENIGINLRNNGGALGSNSMYRVIYNSQVAVARVFKVINGDNSNAGTQIGADISFAMSVNDILSGEAIDNGANVDIIVYKNGVSQATRTDTSSVFTSGKPGISGNNQGPTMFGDNWTGGNVTTATGGFLNRNYWWGNQ